MSDALSIAVSGLLAQSTRLNATAGNIANVMTAGAVPTPSAPNSTVYKPLRVDFSTLDSGGVAADVSVQQPPYSVSYDPSAPYANAQGQVAVPNVDLTTESVNLLETKLLYKANLSVIKTADKMQDDLLDILA